ncbi:hypothetical protein SO802_030161 [Lithocarpus litseifolius]|uniref:glucan endo-1,3-beta-D-glucosidase n=1 Tax=Lithocarpus litseifolius TaxID=425828 RepID=A0AAW2BVQ3_9ROSI
MKIRTISIFWIAFILSVIAAAQSQNEVVHAQTPIDIGVCYGMIGDNLPPPIEVIQLYKQYGISKLRLFDPNPAALEALRGSQIVVTLGIRNEDLPALAASQAAVESWFAINVQPYLNDVVFGYISVGNEIIPGSLGNYVLPVMQFLQNILIAWNLANVKVTTVVPANVLGTSYPPSAGAFTADASNVMVDILKFLSGQKTPLMINVYPYFAYASDTVSVHLDYAQFTATGIVVQDGALGYSNLFDAIVDAFYSAMERAGVADVNVAVSESGWPSAGNGELTTPSLAATYNKNFIQHILVKNGTPKRPKH